jgi:hypothetical protein
MADEESMANAIADKLATLATKKAQKELDLTGSSGKNNGKYKKNTYYGSKNNNGNSFAKHDKIFKAKTNPYSRGKFRNQRGYSSDTNIIVELIKSSK